MGLIPKLRAALVEQSCLESTQDTYCFWARKFYSFTKRPALTWTGSDVRAWCLSLAAQKYSASSRKQALNAIVRLAAERRLRKLKFVPRRGEGSEA